MIPSTSPKPIERLVALYKATRHVLQSADAHDECLQHAQEIEKALTTKPRKVKAAE